jgi:serine O-acetyltransferase
MSENEGAAARRRFHRALRARHPRFLEALIADTRHVSRNRGRPLHGATRRRILAEAVRLCWVSDSFAAQVLYRARARLQALGVPVLPRILHRLSIMISQVCIGDPVVIEPGLHILHGQVVIDGITEIGPGATIGPLTSIGLTAGVLVGPRVGRDVTIGSGARLLGNVTVGDEARVGANAVVVGENVEARTTVTGVPAKPIGPPR